MIRILEFGITADTHGYAVGKIATYTDKKTGEEKEMFPAARYYADLRGCLEYIRRQKHYEAIRTFDGSLGDAIEVLGEFDEKFEKLIAGVERSKA